MKRIFLAGLIVLVGVIVTTSPVVKRWTANTQAPITAAPQPVLAPSPNAVAQVTFTCDGRKYCSQMTSCAEAKSFLKYCPGVEMDGDGDGVPCESQWCR